MIYTVGHRLGHCTWLCLLQLTITGDPQRLAQGSSVPKQPGPQGPAGSLPAQAGTPAAAWTLPPAFSKGGAAASEGPNRFLTYTSLNFSICCSTRGKREFKGGNTPSPEPILLGSQEQAQWSGVCQQQAPSEEGRGKARQRDRHARRCGGGRQPRRVRPAVSREPATLRTEEEDPR